MFPLIVEMVEEQRRKDLQHEARQQYLVSEVLRVRPSHSRLSHRFLAGLGRKLEDWGSHLRSHFDEAEYSYR